MSNFPYAFAATVYFAVLAVALLGLGSKSVQVAVMIALFLGALSQFVIQGRDPGAELHSNAIAYVAMACLLIGVVIFTFG